MAHSKRAIVARRWLTSKSRIRFGKAAGAREESRAVRRRARAVIGSVIFGTVVLAAVAAVILANNVGGLISQAAEQRAQHSLDLLATVGADMPDLTPGVLQRGLSRASKVGLAAAVRRGQRDDLLSALSIRDARGRVIYSSDPGLTEDTSSSLRRSLAEALHGRPVTITALSERDLTFHKSTGVLVAFEPLRDGHGRTYGALGIDLPLQPILDQTGRERRDIAIFVIGGAVALWLLVLPFTTRAAFAVARSWTPGRRRLLSDFQRALDEGAIELLYQPQLNPADGSVHGFEALVRWRRDGTLQAPDAFLCVVESSALMTDLTDRIIDVATAQLAAWREAGRTPHVSINLSATDLEDDTLASRLDAALTRRTIPSDQLTVEVTETAILHDTVCARRVLGAISDLGIQIAVDDFGTGHASISRLHQFPIDEVKVDRSFVTPTDPRTRSYLRAIVQFGQSLGLRVVAEGVEDAPTLAYLRELGCDVAQGYHIAKPLPASQIHDWLPHSTGAHPAPTRGAPIAA